MRREQRSSGPNDNVNVAVKKDSTGHDREIGKSKLPTEESSELTRWDDIKQEDFQFLIALQFIPGLGTRRLGALIDDAEMFDSLLQGEPPASWLMTLSKPVRRAVHSFMQSPGNSVEWRSAERSMQWLEQNNAGLLLRPQRAYPRRLREIPDSPAWLYWQGDRHQLDQHGVAIVGSRRATHVGQAAAREIARDLCHHDFSVVSGLAYGIDASAHAGALDVGGSTIAVLASGLDRPGPDGNRWLAAQIAERGCVVTEQVLGAPSTPGYFPRRNRIVSGLSLAVTVVEATEKSGSMLTARLALEQNRELFAVPGSIVSAASRGSNRLIKEGATLVENAEDIVLALGGVQSHSITDGRSDRPQLESQPLSEELSEVLELLGPDLEPFEAIAERASLSLPALSAALLDLELLGVVLAEAGCYARNR